MVEQPATQEAKPEIEKKTEPATATDPVAVAAKEQKAKEDKHDLHKLAVKKTPKPVAVPKKATTKASKPEPEKAKIPAHKTPKPPKVSKGNVAAELEHERRAAILEAFGGQEVKLKKISHHKWPADLHMAVSTSARVVYRLVDAGKVEVTKRGKKSKQAPKGGILQVKVKGK